MYCLTEFSLSIYIINCNCTISKIRGIVDSVEGSKIRNFRGRLYIIKNLVDELPTYICCQIINNAKSIVGNLRKQILQITNSCQMNNIKLCYIMN